MSLAKLPYLSGQFKHHESMTSGLNVHQAADYLAASKFRVLVADDFEPIRRLISSTLKSTPDVRVICEVSDGLEAIQKAAELQPELILLDIGLPKLNGIDAARQIRELAPKSKILFITQESSPDVVQEAFSVGANGLFVKTDASSDLLTAVRAVLRGDNFVSQTKP